MKLQTSFPLLSALPYLSAYTIDASCSGTDADLMRNAAGQAFDMASQAYDALTVTGQTDSNVDRLIRLLFGTAVDRVTLINSYLGIRQARNENPNADNDPNEIVIYCNMDRLEERADGWYDKVSDIALSDPPDHELSECIAKSDKTLAFTWTPANQQGNAVGPGQVTICSWFLQFSRKLRYKTFKDISSKYLKALFQVPLASSRLGPFDPIDTVNLLDKVLLHEFTHTVAGGSSDDVNWPDNEDFGKAYGWKSCLELGGTGQVGPELNADSLALFASGVRLLRQTPPSYITDDGRVSKTVQTKKRDVPSYFQQPRTPVASPEFEGFITMIKERSAMATPIAI